MENLALNNLYAVEPIEIDGVGAEHHNGIFGYFDQVVSSHIEKLKTKTSKISKLEIDFFTHLLATVDPVDYAALQQKHVHKTAATYYSSHLKYIDPLVWFSSKFAASFNLDLHNAKPMDILDIGTGCGHFPAIANFYGHSVLGIDIPLDPLEPTLDTHFYDDLCEVFSVEKMTKTIEPFQEFSFDRKFDLVTGFMAAFNLMEDSSPYTIDAWKFFFKNLDKKILKPGGYALFSLDRLKVTPEVCEFLSSKSESFNDKNLKFLVRDIKAVYS